MARRLSEAGDKTVLVIEAGGDNRNDPRVQSIYAYVCFVFGQFYLCKANGLGCYRARHSELSSIGVILPREENPSLRTLIFYLVSKEADSGINSGKTLGGGTSINGATWTRGHAAQYNAWTTLLETSEASMNWNWDNLFSYMKKVRFLSSLCVSIV